ncbi:MAG: NosD domain-containing protein [Candidatus Kariarchaeaceae archaeon]|jgi:parallel beta-helix repeat protein
MNPLFPQKTQNHLETSKNNIQLSMNLVEHDPIVIIGNQDLITQASSENWSGNGTQSNPYIIEGLNITNPGIPTTIIEIWNTTLYFCIRNSFLKDGIAGITFSEVKNGQIVNNTITNTIGGNNGRTGITFSSSSNIIAANNTLFNHEFAFLIVTNSRDNIVENNSIYANIFGIQSRGENNEFTNNSFYQNVVAIETGDSTYNLILGNSFFNNGHGISVGGSDQNRIIDNIIYNSNDTGIRIDHSNSNIVANNTIFNNSINGIILYSAHYNKISGNTLSNHFDTGLYLEVSNHNRIFRNGFFGFINARDDGANNTFFFNYWNIWTEPDVNQDGIVDIPYLIEEENQDPFPLSSFTFSTFHFVSSPSIQFPNGGEIINGTVIIRWTETLDIFNHPINYSLHYSTNNGDNWVLIATNLPHTNYSWDTTNIPNGSNYTIKVTAVCCEGIEANSIFDNQFSIINQVEKGISDLFIQLLVIIISIVTIFGIGYMILNSRYIESKSFVESIQTEKLDFLKPLYHKVIIGLENIQTSMIIEPAIDSALLEPQKPEVITDYFPSHFKKDLKTELKGRTVLTLIEIAYQYPDENNPVKLAKILEVPQSTLSNDLKKLIRLNYLDFFISPRILQDGRYRNYLITPKGVSFLKVLKESLELAIRRQQVQSQNQG